MKVTHRGAPHHLPLLTPPPPTTTSTTTITTTTTTYYYHLFWYAIKGRKQPLGNRFLQPIYPAREAHLGHRFLQRGDGRGQVRMGGGLSGDQPVEGVGARRFP